MTSPIPPEERRRLASLRLAEVEEFEITIDQMVAGGDGLGRLDGIPIFVPRSAPGDRLRVRMVQRRGDYGRAEIVEILEPGEGRREPPCPYFDECGGCDLQHLEDARQTYLKVEALRETLRRLGHLDDLPRLRVRAATPWGYRRRTQLHVEQLATEGSPVAAVGYHARGTNQLVPVESCPILVPELEKLLPQLPKILGGSSSRRVDLTAGDEGQVTSAPVVEGMPQGEVTVACGEFTFAFDARCFFQAHRSLLPALVEEAVGDWTGEQAYELYCGVGLFSLPLARRYASVRAVEGDRVAVRYARKNARRNGIANLKVDSRSVEAWIKELPPAADRVLVDPPRSGLLVRVRSAILKQRPKRVTYVSCHPATLARDLRVLRKIYLIESVTALDLFPQTGHLEAVVQLALDPAAPEA